MAKKVKGITMEAVQNITDIPPLCAQQPLCASQPLCAPQPLVYTPPAVLELQFTHTVALGGQHIDKITCIDWDIKEYPDHYRVQGKKGAVVFAEWYIIPKSICIAYMMGKE